MCISLDGLTIVSGSGIDDRSIKIWDVPTGTLKRSLSGNGFNRYFSGLICVFFNGFLPFEIGHYRCVNSVCMSSDTNIIVSASADTTVKVWNAVTGKENHTLCGTLIKYFDF